MNEEKEFYLIENYTMKCRLYPNKEQKKKIEDILWGKKVCNNVVMYDMFTNQKNVTERKDKDGNTVHYPKLNQAAKAEYLNELREKYPVIKKVPAGALSGNNGLILNDMKKSLLAQVNKNNSKRGTVMKPIESSKPHYYCKKKPCMSYTYQETLSKINIKSDKVLFITLNGIGNTKVRGWNTKIRFDNGCGFDEYIKNNPRKQITVNISKNKCGDYYISLKLQNVLKPINKMENLGEIGIDVGVKDIAILSDGTKLKNEHLRKK